MRQGSDRSLRPPSDFQLDRKSLHLCGTFFFFFFLNPNFYSAARTTRYRGGRAIARSVLRNVQVKKNSPVAEYGKKGYGILRGGRFKVGAAGVTPPQKERDPMSQPGSQVAFVRYRSTK